MIHLTENESTVISSFHFVKKNCKQDPNLCMDSSDVDSLFSYITLEETIDICVDSLYYNYENTPNIPKDVFHNLFNIATKEFFLYV